MGTAITTSSNAELIENARAASSQVYHDELSQKIREAFAELSFQEIENAISSCSAGKYYIIEITVSDIFEEKYLYDINNIILTNPLFNTIKRILFLGDNNVRIWLRGDIRKFLPKGHKYYKS